MEEIQKLIPEKIQLVGHTVYISDASFTKIVQHINKQGETINSLIDTVQFLKNDLKNTNEKCNQLQETVQRLAIALQTYMEE